MANKRSKQRETDRENYAQLGKDVRMHRSRLQTTPEADGWENARIVQVSPSKEVLEPESSSLSAPPPSQQSPPLEDPWEKGRAEYKVNVLELLQWTIASDLEHEHTKGDRATMFLMLDNYYEKVMVSGIPGLTLPLQTGEEQAMYFWFYRKSYGYGYSACPMGQLELANKLQWSRDRVKRHMATLIKKGHITPLDRYKMFQNYRPQVFEVAFPRTFLQRTIDQIKDEADRAFIRQEIAKFLGEREISA